MRTALTALLAALILPACAGMMTKAARNASVAELGCPNDEIVVSHVDYGPGVASWQAECHGKVVVCTSLSDPNSRTQVTCREPQPAPKAIMGSE